MLIEWLNMVPPATVSFVGLTVFFASLLWWYGAIKAWRYDMRGHAYVFSVIAAILTGVGSFLLVYVVVSSGGRNLGDLFSTGGCW